MSSTHDRFAEYVGPDERVTGTYAATLTDASTRKPVTVGTTDRRVLCLADDGTLLTLGYDAITVIRSRDRTRVSYRGTDHRVLAAAGAALSLLGLVAVLALADGLLVPALAGVALVGAAGAAYFLTDGEDADLDGARELARRTHLPGGSVVVRKTESGTSRGGVGASGAALAARAVDAVRRLGRAIDRRAADEEILAGASGAAGVTGFLGTVAAGGGLLVAIALAVAVAGIGVVGHARHTGREVDGGAVERRREREVTIEIDDRRTVRLRSDTAASLDRELSRAAFPGERAAGSAARSGRPMARGDGSRSGR